MLSKKLRLKLPMLFMALGFFIFGFLGDCIMTFFDLGKGLLIVGLVKCRI